MAKRPMTPRAEDEAAAGRAEGKLKAGMRRFGKRAAAKGRSRGGKKK